MALQVGDTAPDAELFIAPRQPVHLADYKGRPVVLLFFPLAFSSTCTQELCTIADDYSAWQDLGAQVFGISVDSPYVNVKFAEACKASFPILSDFNKEATVKYGVYREDLGGLRGVAERAVFVIDAKGQITYVWVGEHPGVFPPLDEVKGALRAL
jgi:glutaredoxin-dependent peroxiredoxin